MKVYIERKEKSDREGDRETETILQARGQKQQVDKICKRSYSYRACQFGWERQKEKLRE